MMKGVVRRAAGLSQGGVPRSQRAARALVASHIARKAVRRSALAPAEALEALRIALAETVFFELAGRNFGWTSMIRGEHGFFPHIFMPDYHGPHFEEALLRLGFSGHGPNILYYSLTGACPCHCEYCFAGAGGADPADIGDDPVLEVAREVARLRVPLVNISGGEPLSRFNRLVDTVRVLSTGSEVRMFTTGIGLTEARLATLKEAGLKGVFVSLDTDEREEFDRARRYNGAWDAATAALRACADADMLTFVNCVVDRRRFTERKQVVDFLRFIESIDERIVVNCLPQLATGRGAQVDSFRAPEECEGVAELLVGTARELGRPLTMLFGTVDQFIGCPGAGGKLMNVDIHGNVTVCISRGSMGNLLKEPFVDIYQRYAASCNELKVGFFCCEVSARDRGALLDAEGTRDALQQFYKTNQDSDWQATIRVLGWALAPLFGVSS